MTMPSISDPDNLAAQHSSNLPLDALPITIRQFVVECAASLTAAPELVAIPALVVTAAAIGNSRVIRLKQDWTERPAIYAAVVSPSGTRKTPALKRAVTPLQDLDTNEKRSWAADTTVEQLARLLQRNPRGLIVIQDELTAWVKAMNQYKPKGTDREFYLSAWSDAPVKIDRVGDSQPVALSIPHPYLSVVGCIPPDAVTQLRADEGGEDGFLPRLLFSYPEPLQVRWTDRVVSEHVRQAYGNLIKQLFDLSYEGDPTCLPVTPSASSRFIEWFNAHGIEMESPGLEPFLRASYSKLHSYCARLALIHALAINPNTDTVDVCSIDAAIKLVGYFKDQARKVLPIIGKSQLTEVERCKGEIQRKLSVCRRMKKRDLQRGSAFDTQVFKQAWDGLTCPAVVTDSEGMARLWEPTNRQAAVRST